MSKENLILDGAYWSRRWQNRETGWDAGAATTPLSAFIDRLENKNISILIPGAGNAWEAEYLYHKGFHEVHVLDIAAEALESFKKRNPDFPEIQLHHEDFFMHQGQYDLILEQTFFCALSPDLRPAYTRKMHELLKPGGMLAGLLFNDIMNTDHPPFGGNVEEYLGYFNPVFRSVTIYPALNSIKPREGREVFIELVKEA